MDVRHFWQGAPQPGEGSEVREILDPGTGKPVGRIRFATAGELDAVIENAAAAARRWSRESLSSRAAVLFAYRDLLERHRAELAGIIAREHGKTRVDADGELTRGIEVVEFACGIPQLLKGEASASVAQGIDVRSMRQPLGVVAGVTPFNFPAMVPLWMFPLAIACGNSFVLKPSEQDPSVSVRLAELMSQAGLPPGVLNVVHGGPASVQALLDNPTIRAVSFVGSTAVARVIYERGTAAGKRVQALGGAKNHMVVLADADLEQAALAAVNAGYGSTGQRCMAISVVVALESIADALVERIGAYAGRLVIGDGQTDGAEMGPLVSRAARDKVRKLVESGIASGATLAHDGRGQTPGGDGFFAGPCLFDHVKTDMEIYREEIFGPVLCVVRVDSLEEALSMIDENPYGNGASIFTRDGGAAEHFASRVEAGMVGINVAIPVPVAWHSFGGWGDSLFGDTHVYGPEGIRFYTRGKTVTTRWTAPAESRPDLGFPSGDSRRKP